jgi:signal transduction histidine kinase
MNASSPIIRVKSLWKNWITPRATERDEAFRERTIRGMIVILVVILVIMTVMFVVVGTPYRLGTPLAAVLFLVAAGIAVHKRRVGLAGWLLVLLIVVIAIFAILQVGYWQPSIPGIFATALLLGAVLLPPSSAAALPFLLMLLYAGLALWLDSRGAVSPFPPGNPFATPLVASLAIGLITLAIFGLGYYLLREFYSQRQELKGLVNTLEDRVAARTRDLTIAANVSQQVNRVLELDQLLPQLTELTRAGFGLYHVSVFLYDEGSKTLRLKAGTGEAGRQMVNDGKQFRLASQGLVPRAASERLAQVSDDVSHSPDHFANPILPNTRAEAALPMTVGDKLIGVLDFQAEEMNRFSSDDLRVFTSLADHIAIAVQNASLYAEQVEIADKLREVDRVKSQFLASMSHELRTPLNAILNFTEFVAVGMLGTVTDKQKDALDKVLDSGRHLLSLINDVLDMTKIEAGMMKLFIEENINVQEELKTVSATAPTLLKDKPVQFVQDIDTQLPPMTGDKRRIRQILLNLVSNACKFTEEGRVTLSAKHQGSEIVFGVKDTGPGIAPEDQGLIFEPFKQTEAGIKHASGTGLGLPITMRLIEAHGGRIWVESQPGSGATFYVALPVQSSELLAQLNKESIHA